MQSTISGSILTKFDSLLEKKRVPSDLRQEYRKWLLHYLDFRSTHPRPGSRSEDVRQFIDSLRPQDPTREQKTQAANAISLYFTTEPAKTVSPTDTTSPVRSTPPVRKTPNRFDDWWCLKPTKSPEWDRIISALSDEIKTRHYSRKTLKAYAEWSRKFQIYLHDKAPCSLTSADVKAYLTYLAVKRNVASTTQNQAFNSLLFLFRHVLKADFGEHKDIPRAKKSKYIPTVLSRSEVDAVINELSHPVNLVVKLQYGCGLRIFESVHLRVQDFNFESNLLTVRGKGGKSRTVPIPQTIKPDLIAQMDAVRKIHEQDIQTNFAGAFLDDSLEQKYPRAATAFIWQWFFPQQSLTYIAASRELRRYHLHEKTVQDELLKAVQRAKLTKRITCHTFRHSFATHLLQANYDIRTIQTLLGHSDVRTTMIYTHCIPSRPEKEVKSPLDFENI